jgi:flagellar hook-basal body complex protein FliE
MSDMLVGNASLNNFNVGMKDFMQEFNKNMDDIQIGKQGAKLGEFPNIETEGINPVDDPELAADLEILTRNNTNNLINSPTSTANSPGQNTVNSFNKVLGNYMNEVNQSQIEADRTTKLFASGGNIDVHSVMIAAEKANLSMQLTMQMRNKILQAYQEISRMQV